MSKEKNFQRAYSKLIEEKIRNNGWSILNITFFIGFRSCPMAKKMYRDQCILLDLLFCLKPQNMSVLSLH